MKLQMSVSSRVEITAPMARPRASAAETQPDRFLKEIISMRGQIPSRDGLFPEDREMSGIILNIGDLRIDHGQAPSGVLAN